MRAPPWVERLGEGLCKSVLPRLRGELKCLGALVMKTRQRPRRATDDRAQLEVRVSLIGEGRGGGGGVRGKV